MKTNKFWSFFLTLTFAICSIATFSSCSSDDDEPVNTGIGDYYISFTLADSGSLSYSEANAFIGELNTINTSMNGYTQEEALYTYNKLIKDLSNTLDGNNGYRLSFYCDLMKDKKIVKRTLFEITKTGCTIR